MAQYVSSKNPYKFLVVCSLMVVFLWFPSEASAAPMYRDANFYGISAERQQGYHLTDIDSYFKMYSAAGAAYVETWLLWADIQPQDSAHFNWGKMDAIVQSAQMHNLKLVPFLVEFVPLWAASYTGSGYTAYPPKDLGQFYNFMRAVVDRYKPGGVLSTQSWWNDAYAVTRYQCGTEFNAEHAWKGSLAQYVDLLKTCRDAVKASCPTCTVLSGTVADDGVPYYNSPNNDGISVQRSNGTWWYRQTVWQGVKDLYQEIARRGGNPDNYFDVLNFHTFQFVFLASGGVAPDKYRPYPQGDPRWYQYALNQITSIMAAYGDFDKKIWISETGFPSKYHEPFLCDSNPNNNFEIWGTWDEQKQANALNMVYQTASAYPQVETVMWWSGFDKDNGCDTSGDKIWPGYSGLIRPDLTAKPSFRKFRELTGKAYSETSSNMYYFPWYDMTSAAGFTYDGIVICNPVTSTSQTTGVSVYVGGVLNGANSLAPGVCWTFTSLDLIGGPVKVVSTDNQTLTINKRTLYKSSFNEVQSINETDLDDKYYFTWYDQVSPGFKNWVLVGNPNATPVYYEIWVAGTKRSYGTIPAGRNVVPTFPGVMGGPVIVQAWTSSAKTASASIFTSQRTLINVGTATASFNEVLGTPESKLSDTYVWTWYDNVYANNWVLVANLNTFPIYHEIWVGGGLRSSGMINPGDKVTPAFTGVIGGPVSVLTWRDSTKTTRANSIASQRVIWSKAYGQSFEEIPGYPYSALSPDYYWPWYDQASAGALNWILVSNPNSTDVYYEIKIGGVVRKSGTIPAYQNVTPQFPGLSSGLVEVHAWTSISKAVKANIIASQRVLWNTITGNSNTGYFNEVMGTPLQ